MRLSYMTAENVFNKKDLSLFNFKLCSVARRLKYNQHGKNDHLDGNIAFSRKMIVWN